MTSFNRHEIDALNMVLECTVPKTDFAPKVTKELGRLQRTASLKGFRPGKAPQAMINRMYEKAVISELVTKQVSDDLDAYIKENNVQYLGEPMAIEDDFKAANLSAMEDVTFKFEFGLKPNVAIAGLDTSITKYNIAITEEMIDKELAELQKRHGQQGDVDTVSEESFVLVKLTELGADGQPREGGVVKEDGRFLVKMMSDEGKTQFLGKSVGDSLNIDIFSIENSRAPEKVKAWVLGVAEDADVNATFEASITGVKDVVPAAMDDALVQKAFPEGDLKTVADLRGMYAELIQNAYAPHARNLMLNQVFDIVKTKNNFALPEAFLQKWLRSTSPRYTDEVFATDWSDLKNEFRWQIMKGDIMRAANIRVSMEEIKATFASEIAGYFGDYASPQIIEATMARMINNEEAVDRKFQEMTSERALMHLAAQMPIVEETVSVEQFDSLVKAQNAEVEA